ncbi:bifunctional 5,10-methylenetetrahydrofolate dehydrogenase/5,10-methenyltetrahydrofolate cyclohydrolase [Mycoplasma iguanae]|uniref:Bifunctional protein FolD n=1 Tax=Mycoplasma iguanae TaxID=292461 RepID=A0ABY5RA00_9MOLU|nr:bifunctional 5,10-methylenetetrahydrofolate dehydrogenase/5,10-methenyltetrahydrofolate cyclohydrolase [Mycoplasma iguanae]UVD81592.1 bifunctional 5,10-methylenetetrahydrofolate dehydrogenase/5,10-methenyltetrahydrofolate cyclohydrolase [Mycoplasma iguanae]
MNNNFLLLDGRIAASKITEQLKSQVAKWQKKPYFAIIQVGDIFASNKYIANKVKKAQEIGIESEVIRFSETISEKDLILEIKKISQRVDSMIVQLPLPDHIDKQNALNAVPADKDADGLSKINYELFYSNKKAVTPATPKGIMLLLEHYNIEIINKKAYVIGESNLVGKPTKELLSKKGAFTKSFNIDTGIAGSEEADILIVAAGVSGLVKAENIKQNAIIVDVGINSLGNNKITGDVDFESVQNKVSAISPVPGGVGPMTVIALMTNIVELFEEKAKNKVLVEK